ncbi:hypothetical protein JAU75_13560 [Ochrobactrum sp. Q0168]|uniref:hypothetical protein n=1 Tax=Ochrobactrum sp. Q0168 TaxID=2793241 RepID=UPI0018EA5CDC|nr:hypothetical protein [Ochrobactrum sp. Q0168]
MDDHHIPKHLPQEHKTSTMPDKNSEKSKDRKAADRSKDRDDKEHWLYAERVSDK